MQVATILVIAASLVKLVTSSPLTFVSTYNNTPTPTPTTTVSAHAGCDIIFLKDIPLLFHLMIVH